MATLLHRRLAADRAAPQRVVHKQRCAGQQRRDHADVRVSGAAGPAPLGVGERHAAAREAKAAITCLQCDTVKAQ
jgi:hypothetical protein